MKPNMKSQQDESRNITKAIRDVYQNAEYLWKNKLGAVAITVEERNGIIRAMEDAIAPFMDYLETLTALGYVIKPDVEITRVVNNVDECSDGCDDESNDE